MDRPLFVVVLPVSVDTKVHTNDTNVAGFYEIIVDPGMGEHLSASSALQTFHARTAIARPADFVIKVVDPLYKRVIEAGEIVRADDLPYRKISSSVSSWLADLVSAAPAKSCEAKPMSKPAAARREVADFSPSF